LSRRNTEYQKRKAEKRGGIFLKGSFCIENQLFLYFINIFFWGEHLCIWGEGATFAPLLKTALDKAIGKAKTKKICIKNF
jgi:hypothetical protein